ncbi:hypothetical protein BJX65DRAFT_290320 [Aspergillus insuetus]
MSPSNSPRDKAIALRTSQRLPRSCTSCRKRRVKCTQTIPCGPCVAAKQAHLCKRETVIWKGRLAVATDEMDRTQPPDYGALLVENSALKERIMQLEAHSALGSDALHSSSPNAGVLPERQPGNNLTAEEFVETEKVRADDFEILENTLEKLHDSRANSTVLDPVINDDFYKTLSILPTETSSRSIVGFSVSTLGWIHCAIRADKFLQEHESFWNALNGGDYSVLGNHQWMAIYLSILTTGAQFMDQISAPTNNSSRARQWYDHTLEQLYKSRFLDEPRLETVQTFAILTLSFRQYDGYEKEWMMLGVAINAARCIKMHRLGSERLFAPSAAARPEWSTRAGRELGRRLWWTLVICDWLGPLTRPPSISPVSFDCLLTTGQTDYTVCSETIADEQLPSPLHHHIATAKLAYVFYYFVKSTRDRSVKRIVRAVEEIQSTWDGLPNCLLDDAASARDHARQAPWIAFQQYMIVLGFQLAQLMLCRTMWERWLSGDETEGVAWLHSVAINAASGILNHAGAKVPALYRKSWTVSAAIVSAGVMFALDLLCCPQSTSEDAVFERRNSLLGCLDYLTQLPPNTNIDKAINIITNILHLHSSSALPVVQDMATLQHVLCQLQHKGIANDIATKGLPPSVLYNTSVNPSGVPERDHVGGSGWAGESISPPDIFQSIDFLDPAIAQDFSWASLGFDFSSQWITEE